MRLIGNITNEAFQRHTLLFGNDEIIIQLRYFSVTQMWTLSASYKRWRVDNLALSLGVLHMRSENKPFDFVIEDVSGSGLDPLDINDFATQRIRLYLLEPEDMEAVRGQAVAL